MQRARTCHLTKEAVFLVVVVLLSKPVVADTLHLGPVSLTLGASAGVEWTDNVNTDSNPEWNLSLVAGPTLSAGLMLPSFGIPGEQMTLNAGIAYTEKLTIAGSKPQDNSQTFSAPISTALSIPLTLAHWDVTLSDNFSFSNDPLESTVAVGDNSASQYNNNAAISFVRPFGKTSLTLGGNRNDIWGDPETEVTTYSVSISPSYMIRDGYSVFWTTSYTWAYQSNNQDQNSQGYSTYVGLQGVLTPYLVGTLSVGYTHTYLVPRDLGPGDGIFGGIFDPNKLKGDNVDGIGSNIALNYAHPFRPNTTYSVSVFRTPGVTAVLKNSSVQNVYGTGLTITHRLNRSLTLAPTITWSHLEDAGKSGSGERTDIIAAQIGLTRTFTTHLNGTINYQYQNRNSNLPGDSYNVNNVNLSLNYTF